jgi:hypothetical protein
MTNEALSRRLGRLDKQLGRLVDCLAPPKKTEADRRRCEDLLAAEQRAAESLARRGLAPLPEELLMVRPPGKEYTIHDLIVDINKGRNRVAAEKQKRDAEATRIECQAEAHKPAA